MGYSVRTEQWRCTYWWDLASGGIVEKELYHLEGNDIERKNLSGKPAYADVEKKLAELLSEYRAGKYVK